MKPRIFIEDEKGLIELSQPVGKSGLIVDVFDFKVKEITSIFDIPGVEDEIYNVVEEAYLVGAGQYGGDDAYQSEEFKEFTPAAIKKLKQKI
jgi:hypothetical protein